MGSWEKYAMDANFSSLKIKSTSVGYPTNNSRYYDLETEIFSKIHSQLSIWITEKRKNDSTDKYTNVEQLPS